MTTLVASRGPRLADRATAFTPLIVGTILFVAPIRYFDPMFVQPPGILGLPFGLVLLVLAAGWMLIGVGIVWSTRSKLTEMLALILFTIPATILVVLGPALIRLWQNLG